MRQEPLPQPSARPGLLLWCTAAILALFGLGMAAGGAWLIALDGSWYYLLAGVGFLVTALLVALGRPLALWAYALVVAATLAWSVWEIGLDWWPLAARGDIVFLAGAWLLTPWIARRLSGPGLAQPARGGIFALALCLIAAAGVGLAALTRDEHGTSGALPQAAAAPLPDDNGPPDDWRAYGRTSAGTRYSPLAEITPDNVDKLKVTWTYHTGDLAGADDPKETTYELTPLKVGERVFLCTPHDWAIALDAETGKELWKYDPKIVERKNLQHLTCRGLSYHEEAPGAAAAPNGECPQRLFLPTADARLVALDAKTGQPCPGFGKNGAIDLFEGMADPKAHAGMYYSTSPPVTTRDLVIIAGEVTDNYSTDEPSGVIRAYDVNTGRLVWNFDAGNPDRTEPIAPGQSYTKNSPNSWIVSSADEKLGLLYVPLGNQTPDQWGVGRSANTERFASSIVALDIATGKLRWVYQTVHHDLWDMDVPSQPSLVDLDTPAGKVPALVQSTKRGDIYVLDRRSGQPIVPAPEKPVPQGAQAPDTSAPTQPFSQLTLLQPPLKESDMWGATMFDQLACRIRFKSLRYEGIFTPPSLQGSLVYPGNFGIIDWGGLAVDPVRQIAFANPDYFAFTSQLVPRKEPATAQKPSGGADLQKSDEGGGNPMFGTPYAVDMGPLVSPLGLPCQRPPWGYVAGIDLKGGKIAWMHKNGTIRDSSPVPLPFAMGVPSLGGPIMTAGGVAFLTSTLDYYARAYDVTTGRQLWQDRLPAGAQATPITYRSAASGRQFLLVVAGGHGSLGTKQGDSIIAYALPKQG